MPTEVFIYTRLCKSIQVIVISYLLLHTFIQKIFLYFIFTPICLLLDAGAPVYLYEYQYPPNFVQAKRPSFVGSDHGDEIFTVLGFCFTTTHVKLDGKCNVNITISVDHKKYGFSLGFLECKVFYQIIIILGECPEDEEELSKIMMSYWGNFARTG